VRRYYGSFVHFSGRGEMIPNERSYCEIDPVVKDKWGIPVLRFHWEWSEHETRQAAHFARYRDLTAGGFYTTPQGRKDVRYVGNVPLPRFDGPPPEVLKRVGLA
jgi:hypothetical protein